MAGVIDAIKALQAKNGDSVYALIPALAALPLDEVGVLCGRFGRLSLPVHVCTCRARCCVRCVVCPYRGALAVNYERLDLCPRGSDRSVTQLNVAIPRLWTLTPTGIKLAFERMFNTGRHKCALTKESALCHFLTSLPAKVRCSPDTVSTVVVVECVASVVHGVVTRPLDCRRRV